MNRTPNAHARRHVWLLGLLVLLLGGAPEAAENFQATHAELEAKTATALEALAKTLNDKLLEKISHYDEEGLKYLKIYAVVAGALILLVIGGTVATSTASRRAAALPGKPSPTVKSRPSRTSKPVTSSSTIRPPFFCSSSA